MAPMIKPDDLRTSVYKFGGYYEADSKPSLDFSSSGIGASNNPKLLSGKSPKDAVNEHFVQDFNPLSFTLELEKKVLTEDVPIYKLNLNRAGVTDTDKIIYLPFKEKNITSTEIPIKDTSVCYFITDQLSGCNFYIDELEDGNLVCYHANAKKESSSKAQTAKEKQDSLAAAQIEMDKQHRTAQKAGAKNLVDLRPEQYYAKAEESEKKNDKMKGRSKSEFCGGATVMGFRMAGQPGRWEFWFETSGKLTYLDAGTGFTSFRKGKEVGVLKAPLEIVGEHRRLWPNEG